MSIKTLSDDALQDLKSSGLTAQQIAARPLTIAEVSAVKGSLIAGTVPDGYVIPYFDIDGNALPYYRVKFLNVMQGAPKYRALADQGNYIYFPPQLSRILVQKPDYIIITEGEKKAACLVANGFPAVGLSGVDCWKSRQLLLPSTTKLETVGQHKQIRAKIPSGDASQLVISEVGSVATGFEELVNYCVKFGIEVIILFDSENGIVRHEVQRAASTLGYELRFRGLPIPKIRQLVLVGKGKMGADDFIVKYGADDLAARIKTIRGKRMAFPRHPNPKMYIASCMQRSRMSRKEKQDVSLSILMELEAAGKRFRNEATDELYYFDDGTHTLMPVVMGDTKAPLHTTAFGAFLYQSYNMGAADTGVMSWLATQFAGEPGIISTQMHKVFARPVGKPDWLAYQISDSHFVIITPDPNHPYMICENGAYGVLFEQDQVEGIDHKLMENELVKWLHMDPKVMLWRETIEGFNFRDTQGDNKPMATTQQSKMLATLLFYLSPWFHRWRGTQLPVELVVGEPGSGKSSLYELRQKIITGRARMGHRTRDLKDWYAGITSTGGMFVLDNIAFDASASEYRAALSDEICRLITEPSPHIEMRKLYTTNDIINAPVTVTFAITSIKQAFFAVDLIQRSALFELCAINKGHDARWAARQLERANDRSGWVAHQLITVHRFLRAAIYEEQWDPNYKSGHRLANYEQALMLMAYIFGIENDWIPSALAVKTSKVVAEADQIMEALAHYKVDLIEKTPVNFERLRIGANEICAWAMAHPEYQKNSIMCSGHRLGRYLRDNASTLHHTVGMYVNGTYANRAMYSFLRQEEKVV